MPSVKPVEIVKVTRTKSTVSPDLVVTEEPLELRLGYGSENDRKQMSLYVTMRTPGHDEELCLGFIFGENIINSIDDLLSIKYCDDLGSSEERENSMRAELAPHVQLNPELFSRHFYTTSSCGVCGKASIESVRIHCQPVPVHSIPIEFSVLFSLTDRLLKAQQVFKHTGGLHAAALFDPKGKLLFFREDVGRHNALDKLIGHLVISNSVPPQDSILLLSGRISFELVQKAARAQIPILVAVGAPSSLAVELATELGVTLVGFLKPDSFNTYCHAQRLCP